MWAEIAAISTIGIAIVGLAVSFGRLTARVDRVERDVNELGDLARESAAGYRAIYEKLDLVVDLVRDHLGGS